LFFSRKRRKSFKKVSKSFSFSSPELLARLGERVDVEVRPQEEVDEVGLVGAGL